MFVSRYPGSIRLRLAFSLLCSLASQMMWWASPAQAQGFFQQVFGLSGPQVRTSRRALSPRHSLGGGPLRIDITSSFWSSVPTRSDRVWVDASRGSNEDEGAGSYTTVCVRMCDGFYFPISHSVPRGRFSNDAEVCRSRCSGSETSLFYHSSSSGDMKSAVDLTGRAYSRLPIAFLHRKKVVAGCGCRPEPWSAEARARHEGYEIAAGRLPGGAKGGFAELTVIAGKYADAQSSVQPSVPQESDAAGVAAPVRPDAMRWVAVESSADGGPREPAGNEDGPTVAAQPGEVETRLPSSSRSRPSRAIAADSAQRTVRRAARAGSGRMTSTQPASSKYGWPGDAFMQTH